jgi:chromosome segregation ATPase
MTTVLTLGDFWQKKSQGELQEAKEMIEKHKIEMQQANSDAKTLTTQFDTLQLDLAHAKAERDTLAARAAEMEAQSRREEQLNSDKAAHDGELVDSLNQRLSEAKRECVAWEKCAEQRQALSQQRSLELQSLKQQAIAHTHVIQEQLPHVLELVSEIMENEEEVDEVKSSAVFVEIVRVREQVWRRICRFLLVYIGSFLAYGRFHLASTSQCTSRRLN